MFFTTDEKGNGVELSEYNGKYSLIKAREYKDKVYQTWCWEEFKKEMSTKKTPVKVVLGDRETAIYVLRGLLEEITGEIPPVASKQPMTPVPDNDNIPF
jgi:hypothetical protein